MKAKNCIFGLTAACLVTACAPKSEPVINISEVLKETEHLIESYGSLEASKLEFSTTTQKALKELEPKVGMPFVLKGTASVVFGDDHIQQIALADMTNIESYHREWQKVVDAYQLDSKNHQFYEQLPDPYRLIHKSGDTDELEWSRAVRFFSNPETGKLDAELGSIKFEGVDLRKLKVGIPTSGVEVPFQKDHEMWDVFSQRCQGVVDAAAKAGRQLTSEAMKKMQDSLAVDSILLTKEGEYIYLKTPNNLAELITDIGAPEIQNTSIPVVLSWRNGSGATLIERELKLYIRGFQREGEAFTATLRGQFDESYAERMVPEADLPKMIITRYTPFELFLTTSGDGYTFNYSQRNTVHESNAEQLNWGDVENTPLAETFMSIRHAQDYIENNEFTCTLKSRRGDLPIRFRIFRDSPYSESGEMVAQEIPGGITHRWKLKNVELRNFNNVEVIAYDGSRDRPKFSGAVHPFKSDRYFRVFIDYRTNQIIVYDFEECPVSRYGTLRN